MDNLASQGLLRFCWMNEYMAFLLCVCSLSAFEVLISDGRWCDCCHRSVVDDRIRAEVGQHRDAPVDGAAGASLASVSCPFAPSWGLWPSSGCRTAVSVAQRVEGSHCCLLSFTNLQCFAHLLQTVGHVWKVDPVLMTPRQVLFRICSSVILSDSSRCKAIRCFIYFASYNKSFL